MFSVRQFNAIVPRQSLSSLWGDLEEAVNMKESVIQNVWDVLARSSNASRDGFVALIEHPGEDFVEIEVHAFSKEFFETAGNVVSKYQTRRW